MNESALLEREEVVDTPTVEVEEGPSLRETIEDAVDEQEQTDAKPAADGEKPTPERIQEGKSPAAGEKPTPSIQGKAIGAGTEELKAPAQWKPAVREKWNALPREVKEEIIDRKSVV